MHHFTHQTHHVNNPALQLTTSPRAILVLSFAPSILPGCGGSLQFHFGFDIKLSLFAWSSSIVGPILLLFAFPNISSKTGDGWKSFCWVRMWRYGHGYGYGNGYGWCSWRVYMAGDQMAVTAAPHERC